MSSELRNIGEINPMYNSLWECDIIPQSFCWNVLQDHCWRGWWFWRSNSSMQRLYAPSCWVRFQNFCRNPRTNNNWTSSVVPKLRNAFHNPEGENSRPQIGFNTFIYTRKQQDEVPVLREFSKILSCFFVPFKDTLGGNLMAPELMGHVAIPQKRKEFLFHRGCLFNVTSILKAGLIAGGRESKEGRHTIFFTPLNPFGDNPDEEERWPIKIEKNTPLQQVEEHSGRRLLRQFSTSTRERLRFWQTTSHDVIAPADCICKVISQKGQRTLFERLSTLRPAPKIVLKSAWQSQQ